jgi:type I restriction enzyme M protein
VDIQEATAEILNDFLTDLDGVKLKKMDEIATFNPPIKKILDDNCEVSFLPMADLSKYDMEIIPRAVRPFSAVRKGFTRFENGDVLLAKIGSSFENGKSGVVRNLRNGMGFGSTEFIVIRADGKQVRPQWIYHFIHAPEFLEAGAKTMAGTAQQRVSLDFVKSYRIPVPSLSTQDALLEKIADYRNLATSLRNLIPQLHAQMRKKVAALYRPMQSSVDVDDPVGFKL